jgi:hypothetical protein
MGEGKDFEEVDGVFDKGEYHLESKEEELEAEENILKPGILVLELVAVGDGIEISAYLE